MPTRGLDQATADGQYYPARDGLAAAVSLGDTVVCDAIGGTVIVDYGVVMGGGQRGKAVPLRTGHWMGSILGSPRGGTQMAQGEEPHIEVRLEVQHVRYRSAAWRELWRQIFEVVAEELATEQGSADDSTPTANNCSEPTPLILPRPDCCA